MGLLYLLPLISNAWTKSLKVFSQMCMSLIDHSPSGNCSEMRFSQKWSACKTYSLWIRGKKTVRASREKEIVLICTWTVFHTKCVTIRQIKSERSPAVLELFFFFSTQFFSAQLRFSRHQLSTVPLQIFCIASNTIRVCLQYCGLLDVILSIYIYIYIYISGYYKRNRHFQCCIETKLLMI